MKKEFDAWNLQKKNLGDSERKAYAHPREVWWCALGVNVGAEVDGKNENFERPVLVVRVYNKEKRNDARVADYQQRETR